MQETSVEFVQQIFSLIRHAFDHVTKGWKNRRSGAGVKTDSEGEVPASVQRRLECKL